MAGPEGLRDKLRRLRREDERQEDERRPAPAPVGEASDVALPRWLRGRLARGEPAHAPGSRTPRTPCAPDAPARLEPETNERGTFAVRRERFPAEHLHGTWRLDEVFAADPATLALITGDHALAGFDPLRAVYLDIETTGLSGGAGTWPFLVALGRFRGEAHEFECWQGFLRDPGEEAALLDEVARIVGEAQSIVSFFGKSFDRHRLEDKMRIHGVAPPFEARPHLDLYHPTKRLYGGAWENCRLGTAERELVGLARQDDLPGSRAPAAWFDFLAGRAHQLEAVFQHNLDDVLSLVTLTAHLGASLGEQRVDGRALGGPGALRAAGLARSHVSGGRGAPRDHAAELFWLERALERTSCRSAARALQVKRAHSLRLAKRAEEALAAYTELASGPEDEHTAECLLQRAKLLEHAARDPEAAASAARGAREAAERTLTGVARKRVACDAERRIVRCGRRGRS